MPGLVRPDIHLVPNFQRALEIAQELEPNAVALDAEGVLGNYVGNQPYEGMMDDFLQGEGRENMRRTGAAIVSSSDVAFGIVTNNTNKPNPETGEAGLVTSIAGSLHVPFAHKGMEVGGIALKSKPSGQASIHFCTTVEVAPQRTVLIDDQGVKNTGEAVRAGLKAIVVPDPIGLPVRGLSRHIPLLDRICVREHKGVMAGRIFEPWIYASLRRQGQLARIAYHQAAGIDSRSIGKLYDHR